VSLSFLPVIASLVLIILGQFLGALNISPDKLPLRLQHLHQTLTMLSNGFILTGLLWGSRLAFLIDHRAKLAALCAFVCAVLTLFGVVHSIWPTGELYWPWRVGLRCTLHACPGVPGPVRHFVDIDRET
jgi:AGZA family xanthine/uracil permease-like MFS transporter